MRAVVCTELAALAAAFLVGLVSLSEAPSASSAGRAQRGGHEYSLLQLAKPRTAAPSFRLVANPTQAIGPVWTVAVAAPRQ